MRLLLDTHTFLWHVDANPKSSATATALLTDPANELLLSVASVWEIAIKVNIGKLTLSAAYPTYIADAVSGYRLTMLPLVQDDCDFYSTLQFPHANHRDPFDRMLIVQSLRLGLPVVGADANFDAYGSSTTPTLVLIDRNGIVDLYHPGRMSYEDLRSAIDRALSEAPGGAS